MPLLQYSASDLEGLSDESDVTSWPNTGSVASADLAPFELGSVAPKYRATKAPNSKPAVRFGLLLEGSGNLNNGMRTAALLSSIAQPYWMFAVASRQTDGWMTIASARDDASNGTAMYFLSPGDHAIYYAPSGPIGNTGTTISNNTFYLVDVEVNGASSKLYLNGSLIETGNPGTGSFDGMMLGLNVSLDLRMRGWVAEIRVYTGLTGTQRDDIRDSIKTFYSGIY